MSRFLFALSLSLCFAAPASAVPLTLAHQGRLFDAGGLPLDGSHPVALALYADASGGAPVWSETRDVTFDTGYFQVLLGDSTPLEASVFDGSVLYLGIAVDGGLELPSRLPLSSVPYAILASSVSGGTVDVSEVRVNGDVVIDGTGAVVGDVSWNDLLDVPAGLGEMPDIGCALGQIAVWDGAAWGCGAANGHTHVHVHDAADVTTGTFDVARLPIGTGAGTVAAGTHNHTVVDLPVGTGVGTVAAGTHNHTVVDLPVGTGPGTVAAGTHNHTIADLPVGTGSDRVARGSHNHNIADLVMGDVDLANSQLTGFRLGSSGGEPYACDPAHLGALYFDSAESDFFGCGDKGWVRLSGAALGSDAYHAAASCKALHAAEPAATDGVYWLDPTGGGGSASFAAWCDMTHEGGGWTLVAYNYGVKRTFLSGTYHAVNPTAPVAPTNGTERAIDPAALGLTYTEMAFYLTDPQWDDPSRSYNGFWVGDNVASTYDMKSNTCQLLRRTDTTNQWNGELVYFAGDGANDNGCKGGGSVFTTTHTCDDGGGGVTTNNAWPADASDTLWGYNCISSYSPTGAYKQGPIGNQGLHAYYVR